MSIQYVPGIGTVSKFGAFGKVLLLWNGSVYKLVYPGLVAYLTIYFLLSVLYRFLLNPLQREKFEEAAVFCDAYGTLIPLSFVLAFYVSTVVSRWWDQWSKLPWPDNVAFAVNAFCRGMDEDSRLIRRNVTRYVCLGIVMTFRYVSSKVYKRFPTFQHFVDAGLATEEECEILEKASQKSEFLFYTHWIPFAWASALMQDAYKAGYIKEELYCVEIQNEIKIAKGGCGELISYDWINVPLAYTQVVTIAVYTYFASTLLGRQYLDPSKDIAGRISSADYVFPIFTVLQFLFYVGWLKVAEALMNPYGEDDDDFDMNYLVDRNIQVAFMIIDEIGQFPPSPIKDIFWDQGIPEELPHTISSFKFRGEVPQTSSCGLEVSLQDQQIISNELSDENAAAFRKMSSGSVLGDGSGGGGGAGGAVGFLALNVANLSHLRRSSCISRIRKDSFLSTTRSRTESGGSNCSSSKGGDPKLFGRPSHGVETILADAKLFRRPSYGLVETTLGDPKLFRRASHETIFVPTLKITREESIISTPPSVSPMTSVEDSLPDDSEKCKE